MRLCPEIAEVAQSFPAEWLLIFHGWGSDRVVEKIRAIDKKGRVRFSLELLDQSEEASVVASADLCLVLYNHDCINEYLTGFASEKLALALQCGVPVIAFAYPSFRHVKTEGWSPHK
jgi:glycosyltransferase involved in cell wall biosynthesis